MNIFEAIFLGIVQGLTEFLPVSSSGHLVLLQQIFGFVGIDAQSLLINAYPVRLSMVDVALTAVAYAIIAHLVINITVRAVMEKNNR